MADEIEGLTEEELYERDLQVIASIASVLDEDQREDALREIRRLDEVEREGRRRAAARDPRFRHL